MRRIPLALRLVPALLGLLVLALVPAAWAAETLVLSCSICTQVVATGKGLPANETVRLTLVDVQTGQQVGSRINAPCKDGKMAPMGEHMGSMGEMGGHTLAFTGSHAPQLLGIGIGLLAVGALLLGGARRLRAVR